MNRSLVLTAAVAASALTLGLSVPAHAQVRAVPVTAPVKATNVVAGETLWRAGSDGYTTASLNTRPAIACAQFAKKVGAVSSFSVAGTALSADELAKCNARAKGGSTSLAAK